MTKVRKVLKGMAESGFREGAGGGGGFGCFGAGDVGGGRREGRELEVGGGGAVAPLELLAHQHGAAQRW